MPHLTIEHSANLSSEFDMSRLCDRLRDVLAEQGPFELGGIRVRAVRCERFAIADGAPGNAFADMVLRIGAGRSEEEKEAAGEAVFAAASAYFAPRLGAPDFALSLEVREIDPVLSWKKNTIHARLRAGRD
jgi:5-carboxymethyl-2-hydroxymuconate isomerase